MDNWDVHEVGEQVLDGDMRSPPPNPPFLPNAETESKQSESLSGTVRSTTVTVAKVQKIPSLNLSDRPLTNVNNFEIEYISSCQC